MKSNTLVKLKTLATDPSCYNVVASMLICLEVVVLCSVILFIPYTEIDWKAYMQEVEGVLNGTYDYAMLKGDTGPLVYPAGFVYVFALLYYLTHRGSNILLAQWIYAALYVINLSIVLRIYRHLFKIGKNPPYLLLFLGCTGYRIHSIYVLRLFNDPVAMLLLFIAVELFCNQQWTCGSTIYSLAVSVKMNVLLYAPGLFVIYLRYLGWYGTVCQLAVCALVQAIVAIPFVLSNPISYFNGAFNFGRIFLYEWTVNWRLIPEWIFSHRLFHAFLLLLQLAVLVAFTLKHWTRNGGMNQLLKWRVTVKPNNVPEHDIIWILFTSNFIGMVFSRSLHYQFYVWYFHTLPYLLWSTRLHPVARVGLLLLIEWSWNTYPSTTLSSAALHAAHLVILLGLYFFQQKEKMKV